MTSPVPPATITVVTHKDGVDMYGLYAEGVVSHNATGKVRLYRRAFLVNNIVYRYDRHPGKKSTVWKSIKAGSQSDALERFIQFFEPSPILTTSLRGEPLLIQLRLTDILEIEKGKAPASRYVGGAKIDAALGKFDEAAWEVATAEVKAEAAKAPDEGRYASITRTAPATPTSPRGVGKSLPLNWKEILNDK